MDHKKLKGSICLVVVTASVTAGVAYATMDPGTQLTLWYDAQFNQSNATISNDTVTPGVKQIQLTSNETKEQDIQIDNADLARNSAQVQLNVASSILGTAGQYIVQVQSANKNIQNRMDKDFAQVTTQQKALVDEAINQQAKQEIENLTK